MVVVLAGCGSDDKKAASTGNDQKTTADSGGGGDCSNLAIGVFGPLTGSSGVFGQAGLGAAKLVVSDFEKENPKCKLKIVQFDSQGDPAQAPGLARKAVEDQSIVAVLGPAFSGELKAAAPIFESAGLPFLTSDATDPALSSEGWKTFHRTIAHDGQEGPADADYLVNDWKAKKVAIVDNGQTYGQGLGREVKKKLDELGAASITESIDATRNDYSATINKVRAFKPDAVFCGCLYPEAARLLKQLRAAGDKTKYMGGSGLLVPDLIKQAGPGAEGAIIASAGVDPTLSDAGKAWLDKYKAFSGGEAPGLFAPEWYNAAAMVSQSIAGGKTTREAILGNLRGNEFAGATGPVTLDDKGDVKTAQIVFYEVKGGKFAVNKQVEQ
jgi:branched-chain amino acid transport system substrate-binding protein